MSGNLTTAVLDPDHGSRTECEWRAILEKLVSSLSAHMGVQFAPKAGFTANDKPGNRSAGSSLDIAGRVPGLAQTRLCGVIGVSVTVGEAAWVSCDLLLFAGRHWLRSPDAEILRLSYREDGWSEPIWGQDENWEWEHMASAERWRIE